MRFTAFLLFAFVAFAEAPTLQPVASDLQLMEALIIPSSNALFEVAGNAPKNDAEWAAVRNNALILAESGNLLMIRSRPGDNGDWKAFSKLMLDAGLAALKAAEAKDVDKLSDQVGEQILAACEACHHKYLKARK